jgi:hypothetical protein
MDFNRTNRMSTVQGGGNIVTNGLVLYLDAANTKSYVSGSTVWNDLAGTNNGTLNGPMFNAANGGSIVFDGTDDYVEVTNQSSLRNVSQFTMTCWMKRRTATSKVICGQFVDFNNDVVFELWNDNNVYFEVGNTSNSYGYISNNSTNWQLLTMVFDGTQIGNSNRLKGYVNNVLQSLFYAGTIPSTTANLTSNLMIGGNIASNYSDGNISQFQIYNRALSAAEVLQNFNATRARFGV